jgi:hypothetical protein
LIASALVLQQFAGLGGRSVLDHRAVCQRVIAIKIGCSDQTYTHN